MAVMAENKYKVFIKSMKLLHVFPALGLLKLL